MKITVQITLRSEAGESEVVEVACLERGPLRPHTLGLSLAEARSILAGLEQTMAEQQAAEFVAQERRCPRCGRQRACKGHHAIVFRTPFGKLSLDSVQLYRCACESPGPKTFSPLAELLPERTSPELAYLETKFAALVSYGLTVKLLKEVLPIAEDLNTTAIQMQVRRTAQRLEAELGEEGRDACFDVGVRDGNALLEPSAPWIVGLDGAYVHAKGQRSRTEGWFEVIVGKCLPAQDKAPKYFGLVSRYDPQPEWRLSAWLDGQGLQRNQPVTFLSDGGDTVRDLPLELTPRSEHRKLLKVVRAFAAYLINNRALIPNYGERYRKGKIISTAFVESAVNQVVSKRFVKKQQMQWTPAGAHLLLQIRTEVLNGDWRATLSHWHPGLRETKMRAG